MIGVKLRLEQMIMEILPIMTPLDRSELACCHSLLRDNRTEHLSWIQLGQADTITWSVSPVTSGPSATTLHLNILGKFSQTQINFLSENLSNSPIKLTRQIIKWNYIELYCQFFVICKILHLDFGIVSNSWPFNESRHIVLQGFSKLSNLNVLFDILHISNWSLLVTIIRIKG